MALEVVLAGEGLVAERALEGARPAMERQVVLQVVGMQEAGGAVGARVRTLPCVFTHVDLQLVIPGKADPAGRALEWFLPGVCSHVSG